MAFFKNGLFGGGVPSGRPRPGVTAGGGSPAGPWTATGLGPEEEALAFREGLAAKTEDELIASLPIPLHHVLDWKTRFYVLKTLDKVDGFFLRLRGMEKGHPYYGGGAEFLLGDDRNDPRPVLEARLALRRRRYPVPTTLVLGGFFWFPWQDNPGPNIFLSREDKLGKWRDLSLSFLRERFGPHLMNVSLQETIRPHMAWMVLTTGPEGQPLAKTVCGPNTYFRTILRDYGNHVFRSMGLMGRFGRDGPAEIHGKATRDTIAEYCRITDWIKEIGDGYINLAVPIPGRRLDPRPDANPVPGPEGAHGYLVRLWEAGLARGQKALSVLHTQARRNAQLNMLWKRSIEKYLEYPETFPGKRQPYFGLYDLDLGDVLEGLFEAKPVPGLPNGQGLAEAAAEGLGAMARYDPPRPDKMFKYDVELMGLHAAQAKWRQGREEDPWEEAFLRHLLDAHGLHGRVVRPSEGVPDPFAPHEERRGPEPASFVLPQGRHVTISRARWFDHQTAKAGAGSAAMVGHLLGYGLDELDLIHEAIKGRFGIIGACKAMDYYVSKILPVNSLAQCRSGARSRLPPPDPALWPEVRERLAQRGLERPVVDLFHQKGLVFSNRLGFLVFPCQGRGKFILVCGLDGPAQDAWWPPSAFAGPFLLAGTMGTILADNPLTALKAKTRDFHKQILAVGLETPPGLVAPFLIDGPLEVEAQDGTGRSRLEDLAGLLSRAG
ncbi:MAG: hypothetical protein LBP92_15250 [Deltaproteobacteria bacterium]|jgi:hypothetical protein|nr:hypothetical protein [Deltaproteobacteria bacterium]